MWGLFALVLVWLVASSLECFGCPNHCWCYSWKGLARTDCVRKNLLNTFVSFPHQTQVLDLSYNVITILHGNEFLDANLKHLQDLRLSNNKLHQIDKLSFNGLQLLQNLDLSHNSVEYLHPITFKYTTNLRTLNVSFNPLSIQKDEFFLSSGKSLQFLDMANCRLEFVTSSTFLYLEHLSVLNISRNTIRKIDSKFLEGVKALKYLDISKNDITCNDQTNALLRTSMNRNIQVRSVCERNQKMIMIPFLEKSEMNQPESELPASYDQNSTPKIPQDAHNIFYDIIKFFRSIPSFYAVICGVHFGVLIGSFSTYFCLKKIHRQYKTHSDLEERNGERVQRLANGETENMNFALIPLNTPPGTPPSPYHSRFFPSTFTLSAT